MKSPSYGHLTNDNGSRDQPEKHVTKMSYAFSICSLKQRSLYDCHDTIKTEITRGESAMHLLKAQKIYKSFGNKFNRTEVLKGIDFTIDQGEFVTIMGPSGSGKTTLLNVLSSIDQVSHGTITIDGHIITNMKSKKLAEFRKHHLGFIFQEYNLLDTLTVKENILLPLSIQKVSRQQANEKFDLAAKELGIYEQRNKYPSEISGGQKQRTSAARAFIHQPSIIFADEPTGALDSKAASNLLNKMVEMNEKHKATILMVTHDPVAASYSDRVVLLKDGEVYSQLNKGDEDQQLFFNDIVKTQGVLGGVQHER